MTPTPNITLFFLGASRAIRIAWLLEELNLPYKLVMSPRAPNGLAPPEFKSKIGTHIGKSPTIEDNGIVVQESVAITEYLMETYAPLSPLLPPPSNARDRAKVREWTAAAEGTFMIHCLAVLYARWRLPEPARSDGTTLAEMEKGLSVNVQADLDWLEGELKSGEGKFLVGNTLTAADIMVMFSVQFILKRELGTQGKSWPATEKWLKGLEGQDGFQRAVKKTGYSL